MLQQNPNKNNPNKDLSKPTSKHLDKLQIRGGRFEKRLFILLVIIVAVAIPLIIGQFSSNLTDPFIPDISEFNNNSSNQVAQTSSNSSESLPILENLRELDTDQDGLSDYDELYKYKTSPYIQDSDSDSINDNLEVEQGTDPNCPEGNTCARTELNTNSSSSTSTSTNTESNIDNLSIEQLRQIMIDAGAPEEEVYQIPEDELIATYRQLLAEEVDSQGTDSTEDIFDLGLGETEDTGSIYDNLNYETLFNLNPSEIRELMIEGGVPANELSQIDDETLQEIYRESLYQNFNE